MNGYEQSELGSQPAPLSKYEGKSRGVGATNEAKIIFNEKHLSLRPDN
jgi:hypothetical protein